MKPLSAACLRIVNRHGRLGLAMVVAGAAMMLGPLGTWVGMVVIGVPAHWWPAALIIALVIGGSCALVIAAPVIDMAGCLSNALRALDTTTRTDDVTGLLTRRAFFEAARHHDDDQDAIVVMVDVDQFKMVNDAFGHTIGDHVLRRVGSALRTTLPDALVGRVGGDEFALCVVGTRVDPIRHALHAVLDHIDAGDAGHVSCTFGIASRRHDETTLACLHRADLELIGHKRQRPVPEATLATGLGHDLG